VVPERRRGNFCPPGQAKKGRCHSGDDDSQD
jgi:hypothetical protein